MSLKQSIVIVNEYTVKKPGGKGSRGATPGDYVTRYMARDRATEPVAPIRATDLDDYIGNYMARAEAVEAFVSDRRGEGPRPSLRARRARRSALRASAKAGAAGENEQLREEFRKRRGRAGVAFGYGDVSLSDEGLQKASEDIQAHFDAGHTVMKTVLSFDHDYLVEHGLVPPGMSGIKRGDYRGQLDQMKLRMAIMNGLGRMARIEGFDDLRYVGVIQVDTEHVHAHLAMVDAGVGRLAADGTQKGKLSKREMSRMRRGIDSWLDQNEKVAHLSSAVGHERRNVVSFVKRWAYEAMSVQASAQHLLACLPDDKRLWRAKTNAESMRKPNKLVTEMIEKHLARPGSPMPQVMAEIERYADDRAAREGLADAERQKLVDNGRQRVIEGCVNGVYSILAAVPDVDREVRTPMMDVMSMDFDQLYAAMTDSAARKAEQEGVIDRENELAGADGEDADLGQFAFRLRSYSSRLEHHMEMRTSYATWVAEWDARHARGLATDESRAMRDFYVSEENYHARAVSKYQHILAPVGVRSEWVDEWAKVDDYGHRIIGLKAMRLDKSLSRMKDPAEAEKLGREIYGQAGAGSMVATGQAGRAAKAKIDARISAMERSYAEMVEALRIKWSGQSAHLEVVEVPGPDDGGAEAGAEVGVLPGEEGHDGRFTTSMMLSGQSEHLPAVLAAEALAGGPSAGVVDIYTPGAAIRVRSEPEHEFVDVRGVDLHDMGDDWARDQPVGRRVAQAYLQLARDRRTRLDYAKFWMEFTGQTGAMGEHLGAAEADLERMEAMAGQLSVNRVLPSRVAKLAREEKQRARLRLARLERDARAMAEMAVEAGVEVSESDRPLDPVTRSGRTIRLDSRVGAEINRGVDEEARRKVAEILNRRVDWRAPDANSRAPGGL